LKPTGVAASKLTGYIALKPTGVAASKLISYIVLKPEAVAPGSSGQPVVMFMGG
jgi:hypothetical protein